MPKKKAKKAESQADRLWALGKSGRDAMVTGMAAADELKAAMGDYSEVVAQVAKEKARVEKALSAFRGALAQLHEATD